MHPDYIIDNIKNAIISEDPEAEIYLFGSRARRDNRSSSDWDILILVNRQYLTDDIENQFRNVLYDIELATGQIISIFIYPKDYWNHKMIFSPLYQSIKKEGILLN